MKGGYIVKSGFEESTKNHELDLINSYTRRSLTEDEVYIFSVVLCDNEIDRDYEVFTKESLDKLAVLFVGKTGILDHEMKAENQMARIISCKVQKVEGKINSIGEQYYQLLARAYMPKSQKNSDFILELDSGIKKEVSVSCSVEKISCSICSCNLKSTSCEHQKGKIYNVNGSDKLCFSVLENPLDAYEWSFVAVPAQKAAGVIKNFDNEGRGEVMEDILKSMDKHSKITLNEKQVKKLKNFIDSLKLQAEDGKIYREDLQKEVLRLSVASDSSISLKTMKSVTDKLSIDELKEFKKSFEKKLSSGLAVKPQLACEKQKQVKKDNVQFKI